MRSLIGWLTLSLLLLPLAGAAGEGAVDLSVSVQAVAASPTAAGQRVAFNDTRPETEALSIWRLTFDRSIEDGLSYHYIRTFSPNGRYTVYQEGGVVKVYDFFADTVVASLGSGQWPQFGFMANWVYWYHKRDAQGNVINAISRFNPDTGEQQEIARGVGFLNCLTSDDRDVISAFYDNPQDANNRYWGDIYRIENRPGGAVVKIVDRQGDGFFKEVRANPRYPAWLVAKRSQGTLLGWWAMDIDGNHLQRLETFDNSGAHGDWISDGSGFVVGNGKPQVFPFDGGSFAQDFEVITTSVGDISNIGFEDPLMVGSGDGWDRSIFLLDLTNPSSTKISYALDGKVDSTDEDISDATDNNAHGSPDATKIVFRTNYNLQHHLVVTTTTQSFDGGSTLHVQSTEGFANSGFLAWYDEALAYTGKTGTTFTGVTRGAFGSPEIGWNPSAGIQLRDIRGILKSPSDDPSLFANQAETDIYVAVVALPDTPSAGYVDRVVTIVPGRRHRETYGFHLYRNGVRVTGSPLTTRNTTFSTGAGSYTVAAVEWSGLESPASTPIAVTEASFTVTNPIPSNVSPTFADVPFDHPYHDDIETVYQAGYTAGCNTDPLKYCPDATMNRAESSVFVERGIHTAGYSPPDPTTQAFADLPLDSWAAKWVNGLWEDQYTAGCGTAPPVYCPWQGHTRAEGAVFYLRMLNGAAYVPAEPTQTVFSDVPLDAWFAKWIHAAYQAGLITPCETSPQMRFCPNDPLTRALAAYMMVQAKGLLAENGPYCTPRVYWGALASGSTYGRDNPPWDMGTVDVFESHTQKKISILHFGHPWYSPAPCWPDGYYPLLADLLDRLRQRGVIPLLDWASWSKCDASTENDADFSLARIIAGQHDEFIRQFARDARNWGHPFFLRFDWEMNGDWYPWSERINGNSPGEFVQAWRHVHDIFTSEGAANVSWVWCVNTEYPGSIPIEDLYPGDDYVDWLAVDGYNWGTQNPTHPDTWKSFAEVFRATYDRLVRLSPNKPIMIAETASSEYGGSKPNWITDALTVQLPTYFPKVDAFVWFNWDMDNANWVIESSAQSQSAFAQGIGSTYYSASDFSTLEVSPIPALPHATCPK